MDWLKVATGIAGAGAATLLVLAIRRGSGGGKAGGPGTMAGRGAGAVYVRGGVLYGPGGFRYQLTDDDLLWLARATWGETRDRDRGAAGVIWAMAQYHALVLGRDGSRPKYARLADLLRNYCQPINPRWDEPSDERCQAHPELCTPRHIERRRMYATTPWSGIPEAVRSLVTRFAEGRLENPVPGLTDWAAYDWSSTSTVPLVRLAGNRFGVKRSRRLYRA